MDETKLEVYLGIPMPSLERYHGADEPYKFQSRLYYMLDDLVACSEKLSFQTGDSTIQPSIQLLDESARDSVLQLGLCSAEQLELVEVLKVSGVAHASFYESWERPAKWDANSTLLFVARGEFCKHISDLLVLANVAAVGAIEVKYSSLVQDGQVSEFDAVPRIDATSLQYAVELAEKTGWPPLSTLKIETVWNWASRRFPCLDGFEDHSLSRAIASFSRLLEDLADGEPMLLVWALVGLEALYCQSNVELGQQLREKAQTLLGRQDSFKKIVSNMYSFRSKFVHGKQDFPSLHLLHDASTPFQKYSDDLDEAVSVAIALLAATLQELARRDWSGLRFEYTVHDLT